MAMTDSTTRRARWSAAAVVLTAPPSNTLVTLAIAPALPGLAHHLGTSTDGELLSQLVMVTPAFMIALFGPLSGVIAERLGVRACLIGALLLYAASGLVGVMASDLTMLTVSRLVLGAAGGAAAALGLSVASQLPESWREPVLGLSGAFGGGLAVFCLTFGGILVDWGGWQAPMIMYALVLPIILPAVWGIPARLKNVAVPRQSEAADWSGIFRLWPLYLLMVLECMALNVPDIQGPFLLVEEGISTATAIGLATASYAVCSLMLSIFYGPVRKRLGERAMLVITPMLLGIGQITIASTHGATAMRIVYLFGGLMGAGWVTPTLFSAVLARAPVHGRAVAMGIIYSAIYVGQFVNPALLMPIRRLTGNHTAFFADGVLMLSVALVVFVCTAPTARLAARSAE